MILLKNRNGGRGINHSNSNNRDNQLLVLFSVLVITVLTFVAVNCSLYSKATEDGGFVAGVSSRQETEEIDVWDSLREHSSVTTEDPCIDCRMKMNYLELAVIEYQDSLGYCPSSLEDAWDWWWRQPVSRPIIIGSTGLPGDCSYVLTSTFPMCQDSSESYQYDYTSDSFTITCPYGHGSIKDGVSSWE